MAGAACGIAAAYALTPVLERWNDAAIGGVRVSVAFVSAEVALGVVSATLAAWWPARTAARVPVLVALSGRRPPATPGRRSLVTGVVLLLAGGGLLAAASWVTGVAAGGIPLAAAVLTVFGFGGIAPWVLERLGLLARRLPVGLRLAVRDVGRHRTRDGTVVAAILAMLAVGVMSSAVFGAYDARDRRAYVPRLRDDQALVSGLQADRVAPQLAERRAVLVEAVLASAISGDVPVVAALVGGPEGLGDSADVAGGNGELVRALGGDEDDVAALERGDLLVFDERAARRTDGQAWIDIPEGEHRAIDTTVVDVPHRDALPTLVASPRTLERVLRQPVTTEPWYGERTLLLRFEQPLSGDRADEVRAVAAQAVDTEVEVETGYVGSYRAIAQVVLAGSLLTSLLVLVIALALSAVETSGDQRVLLEVGADGAIRRRMAAGRAAVLAGLGGLLAVPAGLLSAAGLLRGPDGPPLVLPWSMLAVVALVLPALAVLGAFVLTRPAPRWIRFAPRAA